MDRSDSSTKHVYIQTSADRGGSDLSSGLVISEHDATTNVYWIMAGIGRCNGEQWMFMDKTGESSGKCSSAVCKESKTFWGVIEL
mmetsp:Transcript_36974/g.66519  ORF Transcript_36974/g.66519 Transcript_36974/m.66519 type:complete len:85 (+) Transcript_36974:733-987(+)